MSEERERPRYHVEGQTSTIGPRWCIWDGVEGHFARYQNIADEGDAVALCRELNRLDALTRAALPTCPGAAAQSSGGWTMTDRQRIDRLVMAVTLLYFAVTLLFFLVEFMGR
jgi:hypothetical protein